MTPSKAAARAAALLEAPARPAWAQVVVAELLEQLLVAAAHAARASLHLRFGGITRASACSSAQKERSWSCDFLLIVLSSFRSIGVEVRMEGVEPSWPLDRRLLRPVRIPVPPHPQCVEKRRRAAGSCCRACGSPFTQPVAAAARHVVLSRGAPRGERRAARPWPGAAAPASGMPRPVRGGDASPPPLCLEGRARRPPAQRAPRAKSEMSCGVAVSKPTTSSIPGSFGSAIEKPFATMPTTTSRASMPDAWR